MDCARWKAGARHFMAEWTLLDVSILCYLCAPTPGGPRAFHPRKNIALQPTRSLRKLVNIFCIFSL